MNTENKTSSEKPEFIWINRVSKWMDGVFKIPGTNIRFGIDPILGLIPGVGEYASFTVSSILVVAMVRHGVSGKVAAMMVGNILLDYLVGSIPVLGDIFDVAFRANDRNYRLLQKHYEAGKYKGSSWPILAGVAGILLLFLIGGFYLAWQILAGIVNMLAG